jgi:hypothetical protein
MGSHTFYKGGEGRGGLVLNPATLPIDPPRDEQSPKRLLLLLLLILSSLFLLSVSRCQHSL